MSYRLSDGINKIPEKLQTSLRYAFHKNDSLHAETEQTKNW